MPQYLFEHPETKEVKELILGINEPKIYIDSDGRHWTRIFTVPQASISTKIDPFSDSQFVEKTRGTKGTLADMFDRAQEASEKRISIAGKDPVKQKYWDDWSKKRKGKKHPSAIKEGYHSTE